MGSKLTRMLAVICLSLLVLSVEAEAQNRKLFVVTSDYETGGHAVIHPGSLSVETMNIGSLPSDAYVRSFGDRVYVIGRFTFDNITVFDKHDLETPVAQYSTGSGTHPHDILVFSNAKAYVTLYDRDYISIIHPMTGNETGRIDMSRFADRDGYPEIDRMLYLNGRVYVTAQRLDRDNFYNPTDFSIIAVIDPETDTVVDEIELSMTNPVDMQYVEAVDKILVAQAGAYFSMVDGGLEFINPATGEAEGIIMTKEDMGGTMVGMGNALQMVSADEGFVLITDYDFQTSLIAIDLENKRTEPVHDPMSGFVHSDILIDGDYLFVADRTMERPGIRVFDIRTNMEITRDPIDTGLPPVCMVVVEYGVVPPCPMEVMFGEDPEKILALRSFRDSVLKKTETGRMFVDFYYNNADTINTVLNTSPFIHKTAKQFIGMMIRQ